MRRGEERVTQMKLSGRWHKQPAHVHWQEVSAMAASDSDSLEQACAGNTYSEDGVTNIAVNITKLFGRREVVQ